MTQKIINIYLPTVRWVRKIIYYGNKFFCPICESHTSQFLPFGNPPRNNAKCPVCRSLERHRLDWLFFKKHTNLFDGTAKTFLHIAPEKYMSLYLQKTPNLTYVSADKASRVAMTQMDITNIEYPDASFSAIYCSHVLEHIPDDRKAISELHRILERDGWAVIQVPITCEKTYEDSSIVTPEERERIFGQKDHVRRCGPDYAARLQEGGFSVKTIKALNIIDGSNCNKMGIPGDRLIFYCSKSI